jgi:hypothetical protein
MQPSGTLTFKTAEDYLRALHPECAFVFLIAEAAAQDWGRSLEDACEWQSHVVALACQEAKKRDALIGRYVVIEDETCTVASAGAR